MLGAWLAYAPGGLAIPWAACGMVAGMVAGASIGWIAGVLCVTRGVHEVIKTTMLNCIAVPPRSSCFFTGPLQAEGSKTSAASRRLSSSPRRGPRRCRPPASPIGFVIALALAIASLVDTPAHDALGFKLNTVGANKHAARYAGININRLHRPVDTLRRRSRRPRRRPRGGRHAAPVRAGHRRHPRVRRHHPHRPAGPGQPARDDPGSAARRHPAHRSPRSAVRDGHRPRGRRPVARDHPAHGVHPASAPKVDLPQPRRQGHSPASTSWGLDMATWIAAEPLARP